MVNVKYKEKSSKKLVKITVAQRNSENLEGCSPVNQKCEPQ
jgi:hypothetical protein